MMQTGEQLRDVGIATVLRGAGKSWSEDVLAFIQRLPKGAELTGEDIRRGFLAQGGSEPHSVNAWGGVTNAAIRRGLLMGTGRYVAMKDPKSHACKKQLLLVL